MNLSYLLTRATTNDYDTFSYGHVSLLNSMSGAEFGKHGQKKAHTPFSADTDADADIMKNEIMDTDADVSKTERERNTEESVIKRGNVYILNFKALTKMLIYRIVACRAKKDEFNNVLTYFFAKIKVLVFNMQN